MADPRPEAVIRAPSADRPLSDESGDRYGFVGLARRLAPSIVAAAGGEGLVVGVEGPWGVGKTSLLHFLKKALEDERSKGLHVIALAPWLQGDRIDLVTDLLKQLLSALDAEAEARPPPDQAGGGWWSRDRWRSRAREAQRSPRMEAIRRYAALVGRGGGAALEVLGHLVPGAAIGGKVVRGGAELLEAALQGPSVLDLKAEIREQIAESGLRFVVLIDDLDRLEPSQAAEVVRVVRSVADFPRMVYVLSYDRAVLARALERSLGVDDGDQYLQKIVQLALPMPAFEPFDLRIELRSQLFVLHEEIEGRALEGEAGQDLHQAVDQAGAHLRTPRDVTLVTNAIRFAWLAARGDTYFPDVCRIQIIRIARPKLYRWLERYLALYSVMITKVAHLGKEERRAFSQELKELLPDDDHHSPDSVWSLYGIVPGLSMAGKDENRTLQVFKEVSEREMRDLTRLKRLGSPYHHRSYFAFAIPKTVLSDERFEELLAAAREDPDRLVALLLDYVGNARPVAGTWFAHIVDRLDGSALTELDTDQLMSWLSAFATVMDKVLEKEVDRSSPGTSVATRVCSLFGSAVRELRRRGVAEVSDLLAEIMEKGQALNWLVGRLMPREIDLRGQGDDGRVDPDETFLSAAELPVARQALLDRLRTRSQEGGILILPQLAWLLHGWRRLDDDGGSVRAWVAEATEEDETFLDVLLRLRAYSWSSDGVHRYLERSSVEPFLDWDEMNRRLAELGNADEQALASQANTIRRAIENGARF